MSSREPGLLLQSEAISILGRGLRLTTIAGDGQGAGAARNVRLSVEACELFKGAKWLFGGRPTVKVGNRAIWLSVLPFAAIGAPAVQSSGRVLTPSDVVAIRIIDHPELDTTTRVEPDGTINFPYIGRIQAAGRTEDDLGRAIDRRLVELKIIAGP
jgi:hypothetical protein